jgi:hypothetical protein
MPDHLETSAQRVARAESELVDLEVRSPRLPDDVKGMVARTRELDAAASPAPWRDGVFVDTEAARAGDERGVIVEATSTPHASGVPDLYAHAFHVCRGMTGPKREANSLLIAEYRTLAPRLADAVEAQAAEVMRLRAYVLDLDRLFAAAQTLAESAQASRDALGLLLDTEQAENAALAPAGLHHDNHEEDRTT